MRGFPESVVYWITAAAVLWYLAKRGPAAAAGPLEVSPSMRMPPLVGSLDDAGPLEVPPSMRYAPSILTAPVGIMPIADPLDGVPVTTYLPGTYQTLEQPLTTGFDDAPLEVSPEQRFRLLPVTGAVQLLDPVSGAPFTSYLEGVVQ